MIEKSKILKGENYLMENVIDKVTISEDEAIENILKINEVVKQQHGWDSQPPSSVIIDIFNQLPMETKSKYKDVKNWFWSEIHWRL